MNAKQAKAKASQIRADKNMAELQASIDMAVSEGIMYCHIPLEDLDDSCKEYLTANGFKYKKETVMEQWWTTSIVWEISWE